MGKGKRKKGNSDGPSILPLGPKAQISTKAATVVPEAAAAAATASASTPQSAPKVGQAQLPTVNPSQGLRQYTATCQVQNLAGNHAGFLKIQYLAKVAEWAATTVPNLGAFYGQRLAATSEALAIPPPTPHFLCQRCETVLQVDENCSVRVIKAPRKWRKAQAKGVSTRLKSALAYKCHFCNFENKKPGTPKGNVKKKLSQLVARSQVNKLGTSNTSTATPASAENTKGAANSKKPAATPAAAQSKNLPNNKIPVIDSPVGSEARVAAVSSPAGTALLPVASPPCSPSSPSSMLKATNGGKKRKRKGWSTLKDKASGQLEMPTPSRLGFMSPLNPSRKG